MSDKKDSVDFYTTALQATRSCHPALATSGAMRQRRLRQAPTPSPLRRPNAKECGLPDQGDATARK